MLAKIMQHEWLNLRADRTLWLVGGLFAVVIAYGIFNGTAWVRFQQTTLQAAAQDERERYAELKEETAGIAAGTRQPGKWTDPRSPAVVSARRGARYAMMPPTALAALSVGQSDLYPYYFQVSRSSKQTFINNEEIENPTNLLAGKFDLAFVMIYLYPLLILALSYNLLSQEKEQGTLAMMMAQPVALKTFVFGKIGLRAALILVLAIGLSLLGFLFSGVNLLAEGALGRLLLWIGVVALYGAFWFALAVVVNAFGKSSATNAITLAGLWLLFVLLVPSLVNVAVTTLAPVPSRVEMIQATRRASAEATTKGSQLLAKYFEDHPELVPANGQPDMNDFYTKFIAVQTETERLVQPVLAQFDQQLAKQQTLINTLRFLSPAIVTQAVLNDIAGTSHARYQHFLSLVDRFHAAWQQYFNPRILKQTQLTASEFDQVPQFSFAEESVGTIAQRALLGLLGLLIPVALIGWFGVQRLRRFPLAG